MTDQVDLSIYEPNLNIKHYSWADFNDAAQKRWQAKEAELKQQISMESEADQKKRAALEKSRLDDVLFTAEYQKRTKLTWQDLEMQIDGEESSREVESDNEEDDSTESDTAVETDAEINAEMDDAVEANASCVAPVEGQHNDTETEVIDYETSSVYDEPDNMEIQDEEPLDYITGAFEIKNTNKRIEDAIIRYRRKGVNRRGMEFRLMIDKAFNAPESESEDEEEVDDSGSVDSDESDGLGKPRKLSDYYAFENRPSSAERLHFEDIRKRRSAKRITFGGTRVITYNVGDVVTTEKCHELPKPAVPGKSILKNPKAELFETPTNEFSIVGTDELSNAIGRIFNLCDLPLIYLKKTDPILSLNTLSQAVGNVFRAKEICWQYVVRGELKANEKALEERSDTIRSLESEKSSLTEEVSELKEKLKQATTDVSFKTKESADNLELAKRRARELKQTVGELEGRKIDLIEVSSKVDALTVENNNLKQNTKELRASLLEQKKASKPLHGQIKDLENKLIREQKRVSDSLTKIQSLELYTRDSLKLQTKLQLVEMANEKLATENKRLRALNDQLSGKTKTLEGSIRSIERAMHASQLNESKLQTVNRKLTKEREECHATIDRLEDTNHAYRSEFGLQFRQLESKYAGVVRECKIRDNEIRKAEHQLEKMGQALRDTGWKMVKRRDDHIVDVYSENLAKDGDCVDERRQAADSDLKVSGGHRQRVLRSLSNKMHVHMSSTAN